MSAQPVTVAQQVCRVPCCRAKGIMSQQGPGDSLLCPFSLGQTAPFRFALVGANPSISQSHAYGSAICCFFFRNRGLLLHFIPPWFLSSIKQTSTSAHVSRSNFFSASAIAKCTCTTPPAAVTRQVRSSPLCWRQSVQYRRIEARLRQTHPPRKGVHRKCIPFL